MRKLLAGVLAVLHKASNWLLDHPAEDAVPSMKQFLGRLDDKVILEGLQKTRQGSRIPYDKLVTNEYLPK